MAAPSASATSSGVSPPSDGRSSLLHEIGLMPMRTSKSAVIARSRACPPVFPSSRTLVIAIALVALTCFAYLRARRDLRHRDIPPPATLFRRSGGIGFDADHVGAVRRARAPQRGFEPGDIRDIFRACAERDR